MPDKINAKRLMLLYWCPLAVAVAAWKPPGPHANWQPNPTVSFALLPPLACTWSGTLLPQQQSHLRPQQQQACSRPEQQKLSTFSLRGQGTKACDFAIKLLSLKKTGGSGWMDGAYVLMNTDRMQAPPARLITKKQQAMRTKSASSLLTITDGAR
eukprot:433835-Pelagomonas_calceolata.AAC.5